MASAGGKDFVEEVQSQVDDQQATENVLSHILPMEQAPMGVTIFVEETKDTITFDPDILASEAKTTIRDSCGLLYGRLEQASNAVVVRDVPLSTLAYPLRFVGGQLIQQLQKAQLSVSKTIVLHYMYKDCNERFKFTISSSEDLMTVIITNINQLGYLKPPPKRGFEGFKIKDGSGFDVLSVSVVADGSELEFYVPEVITPQPPNEWRASKVNQLGVRVHEVSSLVEFFRGFSNNFEYNPELLGEMAKVLLQAMSSMTRDNVNPSSPKCWFVHTDRAPNFAAQHPLSKALFMVFKYKSQESAVGGFVIRLLQHLGFDYDWLLVRQQHRLNLRFSADPAHFKLSVADFIIKDVLSFFRMVVWEDKRQHDEGLDSFPQLLAEAIAVHQANEEVNTAKDEDDEPVAKAAKVEAEPIVGVRVNGSLFWFYIFPIGAAIDRAMLTLTATAISTTVLRFGSDEGLDFTEPVQREQIIYLLDTVRKRWC